MGHSNGQEALECFQQMQLEGLPPSDVIYSCALKACGSIGVIGKGRDIHADIILKGSERDILVSSALVDMYAKCGSLSEAQEVFDNLPVRDVVSRTSLIAGYTEHEPGQKALECFRQMHLEGISPDAVAFVYALKACGSVRDTDKGIEIHTELIENGFGRDLLVSNTLVDMYAKCGSLSKAQELFDKLPNRDVVSWTSLIVGYAEHGPGQQALRCFEKMQMEGVSPDVVTFVCVLKACGSIGIVGKGREIHREIIRKGFERDLLIGNTLVDMYARCGVLSEAQEVFEKLPVRDAVSWSAMIRGYGINHEGSMAVECFEHMREQGVKPDAITFTCLLTACSHTSLLFKGQAYFKVMREEYGIAPTVDHYTCIIDLLARTGHLYAAEKFLESMWCPPSEGTWTALLSACKAYGKLD